MASSKPILGPRIAEEREEPEEAPGKSVTGIDPVGVEARRLIDCGLAELADGEVVLNDKTMAAIVARAPEPLTYMRVILRMFDATRESIDTLSPISSTRSRSCTRPSSAVPMCPTPRRLPSWPDRAGLPRSG